MIPPNAIQVVHGKSGREIHLIRFQFHYRGRIPWVMTTQAILEEMRLHDYRPASGEELQDLAEAHPHLTNVVALDMKVGSDGKRTAPCLINVANGRFSSKRVYGEIREPLEYWDDRMWRHFAAIPA